MKGFTIIVCTHNPDPVIFAEVIANLLIIMQKSSAATELVIVDNNCAVPLTQNKQLGNQLTGVLNVSLIREEKPGLTYARIAGYKHAKYEWMIFVDDDNLPGHDYINELQQLTFNIPEVRCWGAGHIEVVYTGQTETAFLKSIKPIFQERNFIRVQFSCNRNGAEYYPPGSCMCVDREVMTEYYNLIKKNIITSTDRTGKSLNSAGDAQIVYCCIRNGYSVGSSDKMNLKHLINKKKVTISYLLRLKYALSSCQIKAYNEVFDDSPIPVKPTTNKEIIKGFYSHVRINGLFPFKQSLLEMAAIMGMYNARHLAGNFKKPFLLRKFEQLIGHK